MANTKEIKRRMQSISNTKQITNAMKMVSASKLRKAQAKTGMGTPFRNRLKALIANVSQSASAENDNPLLAIREVRKEGFLVFASNKGLAGGYNSHVLEFALKKVQEAQNAGRSVAVMAVGRKTMEYFTKRGIPVDISFLDVQDIPENYDSNRIANHVQSAFASGQYDKITLIYQSFHSVMVQRPYATVLLPITLENIDTAADAEVAYNDEFIFEPSPEEILSTLLPLYLSNQVFSALSEAKAGEHGARMTAMTAATDNATELLRKLEISFNRARQTAITNEISEIVAGADALQ